MCMVTNQEVQELGSEVWVARGGKRVAVKDMSDEYVRAAFTSLLKKLHLRSNSDVVEVIDTEDQDSE